MVWWALGVVALVVLGLAVASRLRRPAPERPPGRRSGAGRTRTPGRGGASRRTGVLRRTGASRRPAGSGRTEAPGRTGASGADGGPRPGEIWWADVPFEDGPGSKVRPCVVLRTHGDGAEVLKITSQDQRHRQDHVEIPTRTWDPDADHNSFLDLTGPLRVPAVSFGNKAGTLDARVWKQVRTLYRLPAGRG